MWLNWNNQWYDFTSHVQLENRLVWYIEKAASDLTLFFFFFLIGNHSSPVLRMNNSVSCTLMVLRLPCLSIFPPITLCLLIWFKHTENTKGKDTSAKTCYKTFSQCGQFFRCLDLNWKQWFRALKLSSVSDLHKTRSVRLK